MFPILSEAVRGTKITVGSPYFDRITTPIGLLLLLMIGVGPLLAWRRTSIGTIKRNFIVPTIAGVLTVAVLMMVGLRRAYPLITIGLIVFVFAGIAIEVTKGILARKRTTNESLILATRNLIDRNRSRWDFAHVHWLRWEGFLS
jgi:cytochrome c-type biogenesis protein CcmF